MGFINILNPNFKFEDNRGGLVQLVREGFKQVNVISSIAGAIRGGHYHELNTEIFYVIQGELVLEVWEMRAPQVRETCIFKTGDMFEIPPFIAHNFTFNIDTLLVSMYSEGVELKNGKKDIITI